jgi:hypothetical protein
MREILKDYSEALPPITIYLDDIKRLYKVLSVGGRTVSIQHNGYQYDNLEEFQASVYQKVIYEMNLISAPEANSDFSNVKVILQAAYGLVYAGKPDGDVKSICMNASEILRGAKSLREWMFSKSIVIISTLLGLPVLFVYLEMKANGYHHISSSVVILPFLGLCLSLIKAATQAELIKRNIIILRHRGEIPTFWEENKGKWASKVVEWSLILALGSLVTFLTTRGCSSPTNPIVPTTQPTSKPTTQP